MVATTLAAALADAPHSDLRTRELLSSVIISGTCARGCQGDRRLFGTGEIVGRRDDGRLVVLTARHVVDDISDPRVFVRNGAPEGTHITAAVRIERGLPAQIVAKSSETDLAVVSFRPAPGDTYGVATFSNALPAQGGNVVGGPYGALWTVSPYRLIAAPDDATLVSCATCGPGDSGGGVFDGNGGLAGILVSQQLLVRDGEPLAFAARSTRFKIVPLADVRTFVAALPRELPQAPRARFAPADPWARFARAEAPPQESARDPWSRFDARRPPDP